MVRGRCLCGLVSFKADAGKGDIYQCHCTVCQRVTGSTGVSFLVVDGAKFDWLSGKNDINLYVAPSGYRAARCSCCGSPAPDPNPDETLYWIPAGLISEQIDKKVFAHLFVGSKPAWHVIGDNGDQHEKHFPHSENA